MPTIRACTALLLLCLAALALAWSVARAQDASGPCFDQTGFCVADDAIRRYFDEHGGPTGLGYPVSRPFRLRGETVQLFQRLVLRRAADGSVTPLPLLDTDLLPLRRLDGSTLPLVDGSLAARRPTVDQADYPQQAEGFLRVEVPDRLGDRPIDFQALYRSVAGGATSLLAGQSVFGWPTSPPMITPEDPRLVYQRFEYALFRYNAETAQSQVLLLGDYLKALLIGQGLPGGLEGDAGGGPLLRQYNPAAGDGLERPWALPDSNLSLAFQSDFGSTPAPTLQSGFGPDSGWPSDSNDDGLSIGPVEGGYQIAVPRTGSPDRGATVAVSDQRTYDDFTLVVDAHLAEAGTAGYAIYLRQQPPDERLSIVVDANRRLVSLYRRSAGRAAVLWDWSPVPALRGATETNRLTIRSFGRRVALSVNGTPVFDLTVAGPTSGCLWLAAVTWDRPARAIFGNLRITAPE